MIDALQIKWMQILPSFPPTREEARRRSAANTGCVKRRDDHEILGVPSPTSQCALIGFRTLGRNVTSAVTQIYRRTLGGCEDGREKNHLD